MFYCGLYENYLLELNIFSSSLLDKLCKKLCDWIDLHKCENHSPPSNLTQSVKKLTHFLFLLGEAGPAQRGLRCDSEHQVPGTTKGAP